MEQGRETAVNLSYALALDIKAASFPVLGLLMGVFITGNANAPSLKYFIFGGVIFGGIITFVGGLIRDIHKVKKDSYRKDEGTK